MLELDTMKESAFYIWLSRAFGSPLIYIEVLAAAMIPIGWIGAKFLDLSGAAEVLAWMVPLTVFVTSLIVGICYATYSLFTNDASRPAAAGVANGLTTDTRPCIRFLGWEATEAPPISPQGGETQINERPWLTRVTFTNEPDLPASDLIAQKVAGHIEFYDASRDSFLFGMVGQWSSDAEGETETVAPSQIDMLSDATPYYLNLVLKYDEDEECYGINNDTAVRAPVDWRDEKRKLEQGLYTVKVMVHGTNVAETFWFGLINRGSGRRVRILQIST
ncbi:MAG: hypothetical protein JSV77_00385 [Dehalococcoidales bacterium]|nr:MAG: hypothetical protein JSV77_00385 [Dehalococcoidales bacterium]